MGYKSKKLIIWSLKFPSIIRRWKGIAFIVFVVAVVHDKLGSYLLYYPNPNVMLPISDGGGGVASSIQMVS